MLSRVLIALVLASVVGTATGQPSVVGTATAEEAFPRGRLAETVTPERYSLTLEIDPAQPEFSREVEIALRINQATQRIRCASGTMAEAFRSMPQSASRPRTGRGWKARAKDGLFGAPRTQRCYPGRSLPGAPGMGDAGPAPSLSSP